MQIASVIYQRTTKIKSWAEEDRPREKLARWGRHHLSNAELIGILLGSGLRNMSAVELAGRILDTVDENLKELGKLDHARLCAMKGVGSAKASRLLAAIELGRRREGTAALERPVIQSSREAYDILYPSLVDLDHEQFWVVFLNNANKVLRKMPISKGGISGTVVDLRVLFRECFYCGATSIIMAHNHPSGNLRPSQADRKLTERVKQAGEVLDIKVLDHLIITEQEYFSFADEQQL